MVSDNFVYFRDKCYCRKHSNTFASGGTCEFCEKDVSEQIKPISQVTTSKSQGVYVKRHKQNTIFERFHNYGIKFMAEVSWGNIEGKLIRLNNNVFYKRLDFDLAIVKVFKRSILVTLRTSEDIRGLDVKAAESLAISKVNRVLDLLPRHIVVDKGSVVNLHNAFVNDPMAKESLKVVVDGDVRWISDKSKGCNELEAVHPGFAVDDSVKYESVVKDYITNPFDLPSVTKSKLDTILNVQLDYAENIKKHLLVQDKTLETLNVLKDSLSHSLKPLKFDTVVTPDKGFDSPLSPCRDNITRDDVVNRSKKYRLFKARQYLAEYGWSSGRW